MSEQNESPYIRRVFTFGFGQPHAGGYAVVYGVDGGDCRQKMNDAFGRKWAFEYLDEESAGVDKFGLDLVATIGGH